MEHHDIINRLMLCRRTLKAVLGLLFGVAVLLGLPQASRAQQVGQGITCTAAQATAANSACNIDGCFVCTNNSGVYTWVAQPIFHGPTTLSCNSTNQGLTAYDSTNNVLEFCDGSNWHDVDAFPSGSGTASSFSFTALTAQSLSALVYSNSPAITGFTGSLTASVSGGGSPQISINGGGWTSSASILPGQTVQLRMTTSNLVSTELTATALVGTTTAAWNVTTRSASLQVFRTSGEYNGSGLAGLSGADAACANEASTLGYAGIYKAIMSSDTVSAASRLTLSYPIVRAADGTTVSSTNLWSGSLSEAINAGGGDVWTGTTSAGAISTGQTCASWTSSSGSGACGIATSTNSVWVIGCSYGGAFPCTGARYLYCIQQ